MKLCRINESVISLKNQLLQLRPQLAVVAQSVYDEWQPRPYVGLSHHRFHRQSHRAQVLNTHGIEYTEGGYEGDDHAYLIAYNAKETYAVDIPCSVYETGGGYSWQKIYNVEITPDMVEIIETWRPDWIDDHLL